VTVGVLVIVGVLVFVGVSVCATALVARQIQNATATHTAHFMGYILASRFRTGRWPV
jgi:hypothetical protein